MVQLSKAQQEWQQRNSIFAGFIAEFIGTMCIVFFGGWAYLNMEIDRKAFPWAAVGITQGMITLACCMAAQSISGGHFNWAVTLTLAGLKKMPMKAGLYYIIAQTLGSIVAAYMISALTSTDFDNQNITKVGFPRMNEDYNETIGFFLEVFTTGCYMYMVMCFGHDPRMPKEIYGIACGLAYMLGIVCAGPITGGCLNPARIIGPLIVTLIENNQATELYNQLNVYWFYFLGPIFGAILTGFYYEFFMVELEEDKPELSVGSYEEDPDIVKLKI